MANNLKIIIALFVGSCIQSNHAVESKGSSNNFQNISKIFLDKPVSFEIEGGSHFGSFTNLGFQALQIFSWLRNRKLPQNFTPLEMGRLDFGRNKSRSLMGTSASFPGKILKISGIGLVQVGERKSNNDVQVIIKNPEYDALATEKIGYRQMGSRLIASDGSVWATKSKSPFGTYDLEELLSKIEKTKRFGLADIKIEAAGTVSSSAVSEKKYGWFVYSLPEDVYSPYEILSHDPELYLTTLKALAMRIRDNHENGIIHLQIHPGNWYVRFERGAVKILIADWETAEHIDQLPDRLSFEKYADPDKALNEVKMPTQEKAKYLDLLQATNTGNFFPRLEYSYDPSSGRYDYYLQYLKRITAFLCGYSHCDKEEEPKLEEKLCKEFEYLTLEIAKRHYPGYTHDLEYFLNNDERPMYSADPALNFIFSRYRRALARKFDLLTLNPFEDWQNLQKSLNSFKPVGSYHNGKL